MSIVQEMSEKLAGLSSLKFLFHCEIFYMQSNVILKLEVFELFL